MRSRNSSRLPASFHLWWAVSTLGAAADSMLAFALIWIATGHGPGAVALVSTLSVLPRIVLLLFGGVLGDRHGPRSMLVATAGAQTVAVILLAALNGDAPGVAALATTAAVIAVISAFQQPAAIVYPRLLLRDDDQLPRALARISGSIHAARILGVASGGLVITGWSLQVALVANGFIAACMITALLVLRPHTPVAPTAPGGQGGSIWTALREGIRSAHELRIWPFLLAVALLCAAVLPVVAVVLPSTARANGWSATQASLLESAWAAGMLAVTLLISFTGTTTRQILALTGGLILAALALIALALPITAPLAMAASVILGAGTALFTTHIAPALLRLAPVGQMTRFQSLMAVVQLGPPALVNAPFAALSGSGRSGAALLLAAGMAGLAALCIALTMRSRRGSDLELRGSPPPDIARDDMGSSVPPQHSP